MTVSLKQPKSLTTHKPISWASGAVITGVLDTHAIVQIVGSVRVGRVNNPASVAWLIDASGATRFLPEAILALSQQLGPLADLGLTQVALVVPAEDLSEMLEGIVQSRVPKDPKTGLPRVGVRLFASERQALQWFTGGCR